MVANLGNSDNLPNVNVTINDFGLRIAPATPGPKLTIIGGFGSTTTTIPINEPLLIDNIGVAMRNLRNGDGSPSELTLAIEEAVGAGAANIEIVVTDTSVMTPYSGDLSTRATGLFAKLATTYTKLQNHDVDIVYLAGAYADGLATGTFAGHVTGAMSVANFTKQLGDFCYQQTKESNSAFGVIGCTPLGHVAKQLQWQEGGALTVSGYAGATGAWFMTPSLALVGEYINYLSEESGDLTIFSGNPLGAGIGGSGTYPDVQASLYPDWNAYLFGSVANTTDPAAPHDTYITEFQALESDGTTSATDGDGNEVDAGIYVSVIGGVSRAFGTEAKKFAVIKGATSLTYVNSNGSAAYAGLLSVTAPHLGVTNKPLPPVSQARAISAAQAKVLLRHRVVALIQKPAGYVVTSGITAAFNAGVNSRSDYVRVTTIRTTQAMAEVVREAGEAFIGKPISGPFLAALESAIDTNLQRALRRGAIRSYDFAIASTPDQQVLGEVTVDLSMVPAFELITINTTVSLSKGEGIG
jgi:hypothetical protein